MDVINIIIEPSAVGRVFMLLGVLNNVGYVIGLDFSGLQPTICTDSDYENWSPENPDQSCLLGHNTTYLRKKLSSQCFNELDTDHIVSVVNCPCTEDDYECDFGYERPDANISEPCQPIGNPPTFPPAYCPAGETYYETSGYRLEAGNTCDEEFGVNRLPDGPYPCPGGSKTPASSKGWIAAAVLLPLVLIFIILAIVAMRSEKIREKLPFLKFANTWRSGYVGMQTVAEEEDYIIGEMDDKPQKEEEGQEKLEKQEPEPIQKKEEPLISIEETGFNPRG